MTDSCCRILSDATFSTCSTSCVGTGTTSRINGLPRSWSFAFPGSGRSVSMESNSSCARPSSPGTCLRKRLLPAEPFAVWIRLLNGRRVPLQPTGEPGEAVAAVRFRARQLSAALHPTIPVHAPLVFDLIDRWKERSVGRCTYHTGPPDGQVYTARPANAAEAEGRRRDRFQTPTPPPGPMQAPEEETNPIYPMTLDLRVP